MGWTGCQLSWATQKIVCTVSVIPIQTVQIYWRVVQSSDTCCSPCPQCILQVSAEVSIDTSEYNQRFFHTLFLPMNAPNHVATVGFLTETICSIPLTWAGSAYGSSQDGLNGLSISSSVNTLLYWTQANQHPHVCTIFCSKPIQCWTCCNRS